MSIFDRITKETKSFIVAEIGSNHNGSFDLALSLIDLAKKAGANAVKFQSFLADQLVRPADPDYKTLKRLEVPQGWYLRLQAESKARGLVFFSTATNDVTLGWMEEIGVELYKIASPNLTHLPLIRKTSSLGKAVIMSTGMASVKQIDEAVQAFTSTGNRQLCLLHCVSEYPARPESINLRFMETLQAIYPYPVGFSDHTLEIGTSIAAVTLGARVIEKHVTLDRSMEGPDHHYALEPEEFISMCRNIRAVEEALGSKTKTISPSEAKKSDSYWRSLHAAEDLAKGTVLQGEHISIVRPNDGLHSRHLEDVIGLAIQKPLTSGEPITWEVFKKKRHD